MLLLASIALRVTFTLESLLLFLDSGRGKLRQQAADDRADESQAARDERNREL